MRSIKSENNLSGEVTAVEIRSIDSNTDWSDALTGVDTVVHLAALVHVMNDLVAGSAICIPPGECSRD